MSYSIVIPSKSAANLVPCVRAIREAGETCRIIVVDDFPYPLPQGFDWQTSGLDLSRDLVVTGKDPFVFSRNVNLGIAAADTDDVIVMNDDALLKTPNGFAALEEAARDFGGMVSAACTNVGNPNQFPRAGGKLRMEYRMVCFVCVYIPRYVIDRVGPLDETFVDYGCEDDDYCLRVRYAGFPIGVFDGCVIDHGSLQSSFRGEATAGGDFRPNLRRFIKKHGLDNWMCGKAHSKWKELF